MRLSEARWPGLGVAKPMVERDVPTTSWYVNLIALPLNEGGRSAGMRRLKANVRDCPGSRTMSTSRIDGGLEKVGIARPRMALRRRSSSVAPLCRTSDFAAALVAPPDAPPPPPPPPRPSLSPWTLDGPASPTLSPMPSLAPAVGATRPRIQSRQLPKPAADPAALP